MCGATPGHPKLQEPMIETKLRMIDLGGKPANRIGTREQGVPQRLACVTIAGSAEVSRTRCQAMEAILGIKFPWSVVNIGRNFPARLYIAFVPVVVANLQRMSRSARQRPCEGTFVDDFPMPVAPVRAWLV